MNTPPASSGRADPVAGIGGDFLRDMLERSSDAFVALDREWRYTYFSAGAAQLLGRRREAMIGRCIWTEFPTSAGRPFERAYRRAMEERTFVEIDEYYPSYDVWFENRIFPTAEGIAVFYRDITPRKRAEADLRLSHERFRLAARATNDAVWDWDLASGKMWWSEGFRTLFGYALEELEPGLESWTSRLHPDDLAQAEATLLEVIKPGGGTHWTAEYRFRRRDGAYADIFDRGFVLRDAEGRGVRMIGAMQDITHRKAGEARLRASEARFRALFERAPVGIAHGDVHAIDFGSVNQRYCDIVGYTREELAGMNFTQFTHPDDLPADLANMARLRAGEIGHYQMEKRFIRRDGTVAWALLTVVPLWTPGEPPGHFMAVLADITQRKLAEQKAEASREQLRALAARLQTVREEQSTHIAREIHDVLGQQLTALKLDLAWLKRRIAPMTDPNLAAALTERLAATSQLADAAIDTVQKIATALRPGLLDQLGLAAALEHEARAFAARAGVACTCDLPAGPLALTEAVGIGVFRIFQEALTNIARHAHATEVRVRLARTAGGLCLEVRDNGRGLAPRQSEGKRSLGLLGMSERARLMGGRLEFGAGPDGGTTVMLTVPLAPG
jgi:two-component system, NarL family, sensor histidine kinase UhpB